MFKIENQKFLFYFQKVFDLQNANMKKINNSILLK